MYKYWYELVEQPKEDWRGNCLHIVHVVSPFLVFHCPLRDFGSPYLGSKAQQPQELRYPLLPVSARYFECPDNSVTASVWIFFNVRTDIDTCDCTWGCKDESAQKVDCGRKIPCLTGDSNLGQYCAWLFSRTLYQLSYRLCFRSALM